MNDRFKFRYYYEKFKKIYDVITINFDIPYASICISSEELLHIGKRDFKWKNLMQCTGIRDKNGKLIYEGDIVEVQYLGPQISLFKNEYSKQPENERFEVFCDEDLLKFYAKNDHYRKTCEIHSFDLEKIRINSYNKVYEVIGNIYENQEV